MGKQVRGRTPEEQIIYEEIIERLMSGERPGVLAEEYQLNPALLRQWKSVRKRNDAKELAKRSNALTVYSEAKAAQAIDNKGVKLSVINGVTSPNDAIPSVIEPYRSRNDVLGDDLKSVLLEQALVSKASLASLRGSVGKGLCQAHSTFLSLFERLEALLAAGGVYVVETSLDDTPDSKTFEPLTLPELKTASSMLKELTKAFSDFHLLPHGSMRAAPVKFSDSIPPQHLHLHSHGGTANNPTGLDALPASAAVEVSASDLHQEQDELLDLM